MRKYLDGCKTGNSRFDGDEAIQIIKNAGGIPVWAHPLGGEGEKHLSKEEFLPRLETMIASGIQGLECYYSRYNQEEIEILVKKHMIWLLCTVSLIILVKLALCGSFRVEKIKFTKKIKLGNWTFSGLYG